MRHSSAIPLSAILLVIASAACFTVIDTTVKYLGERIPVPLLVWVRWGLQALLMLVVMGPRMGRGLVRTSNPMLHLLRGMVLISSSLCFFSALKFLPLAESTALNYCTPLMVTLMAGWFLRERLTRPRWMFVGAGFVGMLLILRPGGEMLHPASILALAAAALYAVFQILTRRLAGENLVVLLFIPSVIGAAAMSVVVPFFDYHTSLSVYDVALLLAVGVAGTVGHLLFTLAFQRASASAIAPFTYIQLVWSTIAGWLVFRTFPDRWTLAGMVVIAGSGVVLTWYERRRAGLPASEPAAVD
jgi:drug/metabolite transporter (DMT)-like permease